ncbi:MAG: hypothetical protein AABW50_03330 [Nanoarchaeota archaeon]
MKVELSVKNTSNNDFVNGVSVCIERIREWYGNWKMDETNGKLNKICYNFPGLRITMDAFSPGKVESARLTIEGNEREALEAVDYVRDSGQGKYKIENIKNGN